MAKVHGKVSVLKLDDLAGALQDVTSYFKSMKYKKTADRPDTTMFGNNAMRKQLLGLRDVSIGADGLLQVAAATKVHGKSTRLFVDGYALYGQLNKGSVKRTMSLPETQSFGKDWKCRELVGVMDGSVSFSGQFDAVAAGVDERLRAAAEAQAAVIVAIGPNGFAIGQPVDLVQLVEGSYDLDTGEEKAVDIAGEFNFEDRADLGQSLHDILTAETGAGNFASINETGATSGGGVGQLHLQALTGTNVIVKIQHSTDDAVWVDLITFASATAAGQAQRIEVSGTVNQYVRAIISGGTFSSATFLVAFARRAFTVATAGTMKDFAGLLEKAASTTFEAGVEGGTTGKRKLSGECRLASFDYDFDENGPTGFSVSIVSTDTVTEGTFA